MSKKRAIQNILFIAYILFIVWYTLLKREPQAYRIFRPDLFWAFRGWLNDDPVGKIESIQYIMNILFFIPYGFLFPWKNRNEKISWKRILITAAVTSAFIEFTQYVFVLGECEFDDVISNTLGAMMGYGLSIVMRGLLNQIVGKEI